MAKTGDDVFSVSCTAPVNIAVIKYWGKRDEDLVLPTNGSISVTLDQEQLRAKTTVAVARHFSEDQMWLNGKQVDISIPRIQQVLQEIRRRARKRSTDDGNVEFSNYKVHICSENNFPTAAGLASSAAGYACLVFALAKLFHVDGDISEIARRGSGSACRSVYGGFVEWRMGTNADGSDSIAHQVASESHWPDMRILILVVSDKKKPIGSTDGMRVTTQTSELHKYRADNIVPRVINKMSNAINNKDFQTFAELTMRDSNQLHAVCFDTYPPISYLTDVSHSIIRLVHDYNRFKETLKVAYTFDAGPNACLYLMKEDVDEVLSAVSHRFPQSPDCDVFVKGLPWHKSDISKELLNSIGSEQDQGALQYVIHTKVGPGPQVLQSLQSLLGKDGQPVKTSS